MEKRGIIGLALFLAAFGFYLHGAYPSVSVGDSGEFITAGHTLGIPHAPGFPAYVLLAKCAVRVFPWGNIGYRLNLFSAFCAALSVVVIFFTAARLSLHQELAVCAAVLYMLSPALRVNAQASEVFALHALFCGAVLWSAMSGRWLLSAFLFGLGLGNHQTILFLAPALMVAYIARPTTERHSLLTMALFLAVGLSIYSYLFFRAAQSPVMNGGDPQTLERLWRVLTRADYGSLTLALGEAPARTPENTGYQVLRFIEGLSRQVTPVGLIVGSVGIIGWMRKQYVPTMVMAVAFVMIGPFFFLLGNLPFDAQSIGLLERFYIVPTFCWVLLMMAGVQFVTERWRWLGRLAFALPLFIAFQEAGAFPMRHDLRAYAYGRNNLRTLPPNSLFMMDGGDDTFYTLAYLTQVENRRRDVELRDRGGVVFPGFYGADFRQLTHEEKEKRRQQVERAVLASGRPMFYSTMNEQVLPDHPQQQHGILYHPSTSPASEPAQWTFYDLTGIAPWGAPSRFASDDYRTRALLPFYAYQRSVQAARAARWEDALGFAASAQAAGPDVVWLIPNLIHNAYQWAQTNFQAGHTDLAERLYRDILIWDPKESTAWSNLGAIHERMQNLNLAIEDYQKAIQIDPTSKAAHYNLAVAYWKLQNWPKVVDEFTRVLSMDPDNAAAKQYLDQAKARAGFIRR